MVLCDFCWLKMRQRRTVQHMSAAGPVISGTKIRRNHAEHPPIKFGAYVFCSALSAGNPACRLRQVDAYRQIGFRNWRDGFQHGPSRVRNRQALSKARREPVSASLPKRGTVRRTDDGRKFRHAQYPITPPPRRRKSTGTAGECLRCIFGHGTAPLRERFHYAGYTV